MDKNETYLHPQKVNTFNRYNMSLLEKIETVTCTESKAKRNLMDFIPAPSTPSEDPDRQ